jgi:hypothetical protein
VYGQAPAPRRPNIRPATILRVDCFIGSLSAVQVNDALTCYGRVGSQTSDCFAATGIAPAPLARTVSMPLNATALATAMAED